jgi:hypothetical protein
VQIERGFSGKPDAWRRRHRFQNAENGLPKDRRLCTDGFIIRAQATIRTDSFSSVQGFANTYAPRLPTAISNSLLAMRHATHLQ